MCDESEEGFERDFDLERLDPEDALPLELPGLVGEYGFFDFSFDSLDDIKRCSLDSFRLCCFFKKSNGLMTCLSFLLPFFCREQHVFAKPHNLYY